MKWKKRCFTILVLAIFLLLVGCGETTAEETKAVVPETETRTLEPDGNETEDSEMGVQPSESVGDECAESQDTLTLAGISLDSAFLREEDGSIVGVSGRRVDLNELFEANSFVKEKPFFVSMEHPNIRPLTLYYNAETEVGIGLLGEEPCTAFGFVGISDASKGTWDMWEQWKKAGAVPPMGEPVEMKGYHAESEYDEAGRLAGFRSYGDLSDVDQPEKAWITVAEYTYDENGVLRFRKWARNPWANEFGTTNSSIESYFDELGRVVYEDCYITHGSMELYYIYEEESTTPAYCLFLDLCWAEVWLGRYGTD